MLMTARFRRYQQAVGRGYELSVCQQVPLFHDSTNFYGSTGNARGQAV